MLLIQEGYIFYDINNAVAQLYILDKKDVRQSLKVDKSPIIHDDPYHDNNNILHIN